MFNRSVLILRNWPKVTVLARNVLEKTRKPQLITPQVRFLVSQPPTNKEDNPKDEKEPDGLFTKLKFYIKRYGYIAIPVHMFNCFSWFSVIYLAVRSGVDVIGLLEALHLPDSIIHPMRNVPQSAGFIVLTLLIYKFATPIRYAASFFLIRSAIKKFIKK